MTMLPTYFPSPPQGVWHLGPLPVRAYALFIITGIVAALILGDRRWEARGGKRGVIYDIALWVVPFGLIGGRLYHLATDWRTYWGPGGAGLSAALRIWDGGLGIWGAVALGVLGAWIACRRRAIPLPAFLDAIAPGIILAQAIGRLGNYFNQELYGRETTLPWGLEIFYRRDPSGYIDPHSLDGVSTGQLAAVVQPTFLYELLWNVLVFVILIYVDRRFAIGHGRLFASYVALYCVGRFWVELLRDDTATHIAGIRINSFTSTFVFIGAVVYIMAAPKGREDPESLRGNDYDPDRYAKPKSEVEPAVELATVAAAGAVASAAAPVIAEEGGGSAGSGDTAESAEPEAEAEEPEAEAVADEAEAPAAEEPAAAAEEPEAEEPEEPEAEAAEPDSEEPAAEASAAEAEEPEAEEPEAEEPEAEEPEAEEPEAEEPKEPDTEAVEAEAEAEAEEPEAEAAEETEVAEAAVEETVEPESEESESEEATVAEPPAEEPPAEKPSAAQDVKESRRRWPLRRRSRG
jgi:prolipoprotein diacylglyceryl transferase